MSLAYEYLPYFCPQCNVVGHSSATCRKNPNKQQDKPKGDDGDGNSKRSNAKKPVVYREKQASKGKEKVTDSSDMPINNSFSCLHPDNATSTDELEPKAAGGASSSSVDVYVSSPSPPLVQSSADSQVSDSPYLAESIRIKLELVRQGLPLPSPDVVVQGPEDSLASKATTLVVKKSWGDMAEESEPPPLKLKVSCGNPYGTFQKKALSSSPFLATSINIV